MSSSHSLPVLSFDAGDPSGGSSSIDILSTDSPPRPVSSPTLFVTGRSPEIHGLDPSDLSSVIAIPTPTHSGNCRILPIPRSSESVLPDVTPCMRGALSSDLPLLAVSQCCPKRKQRSSVCIFDCVLGYQTAEFGAGLHRGSIFGLGALSSSGDDTLILSGDTNSRLFAWRASDGKRVVSFAGEETPSRIRRLHVMQKNRIFVGGYYPFLSLFRITERTQSSGNLATTTTTTTTSTKNYEKMSELVGHSACVHGLASIGEEHQHATGQGLLFSCARDSTLRMWDVGCRSSESGGISASRSQHQIGCVGEAQLCSGGRSLVGIAGSHLLVVGVDCGAVEVWDWRKLSSSTSSCASAAVEKIEVARGGIVWDLCCGGNNKDLYAVASSGASDVVRFRVGMDVGMGVKAERRLSGGCYYGCCFVGGTPETNAFVTPTTTVGGGEEEEEEDNVDRAPMPGRIEEEEEEGETGKIEDRAAADAAEIARLRQVVVQKDAEIALLRKELEQAKAAKTTTTMAAATAAATAIIETGDEIPEGKSPRLDDDDWAFEKKVMKRRIAELESMVESLLQG